MTISLQGFGYLVFQDLAGKDLEADMTFQISDNLPAMDGRIYKGEINLLIPFANRIFSELDRFRAGSMAIKEEESLIESRTIRKSLDHTTS